MSSASRAVTILGALSALAIAPAHGSAQSTSADSGALPLPIPRGAHLRVRSQGAHGSTFSGRLRVISNDSLTLALDDDATATIPFALGEIGRVEVERDEKTREQAATVMSVVGAAGGLTAAVFWCVHNQADCQDDAQRMQYAAENDSTYIGTSLLMIMGGAIVGGLIGYALAPPPHWELVVFPARTSRYDGSPGLLLNVGLRYSLGGRRRR